VRVIMYHELHSLDVLERVTYKLGVMVYNCLHATALRCLSELRKVVSIVALQRYLRSVSQNEMMAEIRRLSVAIFLPFRNASEAVHLLASFIITAIIINIFEKCHKVVTLEALAAVGCVC